VKSGDSITKCRKLRSASARRKKNPKDRLHDAADVRIELAHAFDDDAASREPVERRFG